MLSGHLYLFRKSPPVFVGWRFSPLAQVLLNADGLVPKYRERAGNLQSSGMRCSVCSRCPLLFVLSNPYSLFIPLQDICFNDPKIDNIELVVTSLRSAYPTHR